MSYRPFFCWSLGYSLSNIVAYLKYPLNWGEVQISTHSNYMVARNISIVLFRLTDCSIL